MRADIRTLLRPGAVVLGPMAGVTEAPFRAICKRMGADLTYTEMVSAKGLHYSPDAAESRGLLRFAVEEVPCGVQLFGADPAMMAEPARRLVERYGKAIALIDLNMGCPVPKVVGKGEGSALMRTPELAAEIVRAITRALSDGPQHPPVPVTVKFRAGWDASCVNAVDFALAMEEAGAAALTVHGRTREQFYRGAADWGVIAAVKAAVHVPVIGSGDVFSAGDALRMLEETGVDTVMIARGAQGNPWIFREARVLIDDGIVLAPPSHLERIAMARDHSTALVAFAGERAFTRMRKHVGWYVHGMPGAAHVRERVNHVRSYTELDALLAEYAAYIGGLGGHGGDGQDPAAWEPCGRGMYPDERPPGRGTRGAAMNDDAPLAIGTLAVPAGTIEWLTGDDNPAVAVLTRRELLGEPDSPAFAALWSHRNAYEPVARILDLMVEDGSWARPARDYQKYGGSLWQLHFLGELHANGDDPRVRRAAAYAFSRQLADGSWSASNATESGSIPCLTANVGRALARLGYARDERVAAALDHCVRLYASLGAVNCRQGHGYQLNGYCHMLTPKELLFLAEVPHGLWPEGAEELRGACVAALRDKRVLHSLPAEYREYEQQYWGLPVEQREGLRERFLAKHTPLTYGPKPGWTRLGFPLSYNSDALEALHALARIGETRRQEYEPALELVRWAADSRCRWLLRTTHNGKMLADVEAKGQPSKWLTLRALTVLAHFTG